MAGPRAHRAAAAIGAALALAAGRASADPVVTLPDDALGAPYWAAIRQIADLEQPYVEEEFFLEGTATVYTYATLPAVRGDIVPVAGQVDLPYETRFVVRRPADPADFDGTVVVEWMNSTSGFDVATVWDVSAEYFARKGVVYVGWTNSNQSLAFLLAGCRPIEFLPATCGTRYASLVLPDNGQAYEIGTQLAALLRGPESPLPEGFVVERLYHAGQSQQGGSIVTYASAFHEPGVNDGYFIQTAGVARAINAGTPCTAEGAPPFPDCTPVLEGDERLVRTDLPVPVVRVQTETDLALLGVLTGDTRQEDTDTFRYYEMAGVAHTPVHRDVELFDIGITLDTFCAEELNSMADGPVFGSYLVNAMWENLERQVQDGVPPPRGERVKTAGDEIARDVFGNALGGVRLPELDVPVARYGPSASVSPTLPIFIPSDLANLFCRLTGTVTPFDESLLGLLYPTAADFVGPYRAATDALVEARFLLPEDAETLKARAVPEPDATPLLLVACATLAARARRSRFG